VSLFSNMDVCCFSEMKGVGSGIIQILSHVTCSHHDIAERSTIAYTFLDLS
jgi:hypothetical protein